jgi:hypothetical protein
LLISVKWEGNICARGEANGARLAQEVVQEVACALLSLPTRLSRQTQIGVTLHNFDNNNPRNHFITIARIRPKGTVMVVPRGLLVLAARWFQTINVISRSLLIRKLFTITVLVLGTYFRRSVDSRFGANNTLGEYYNVPEKPSETIQDASDKNPLTKISQLIEKKSKIFYKLHPLFSSLRLKQFFTTFLKLFFFNFDLTSYFRAWYRTDLSRAKNNKYLQELIFGSLDNKCTLEMFVRINISQCKYFFIDRFVKSASLEQTIRTLNPGVDKQGRLSSSPYEVTPDLQCFSKMGVL